MSRPNIIVTGMARSGTSLTASVFASKGYYVGEQASEADLANPRGYFEAKRLIDANVELLRSAGFAYHNTWMYEPVDEQVTAGLRRLTPTGQQRELIAQYHQRAPWVWKDVRLCFTLPVWLQLLDIERTRFILVLRRPEGICHSIKRHGAKKQGECSVSAIRRLAEQHLASARTALESAGAPYIEVWYEDYLSRPEKLATTLSGFTGVELATDDLNVVPALNHDTCRDRLLAGIRAQLDHPWLRPLKRGLKMVLAKTARRDPRLGELA